MNMIFWDADTCNLHLEMEKVLNHENCLMLITFFPIFMILILIQFFLVFAENIDFLSLFGRHDNSCNLILYIFFENRFRNSLRVYVLFDHLKIGATTMEQFDI